MGGSPGRLRRVGSYGYWNICHLAITEWYICSGLAASLSHGPRHDHNQAFSRVRQAPQRLPRPHRIHRRRNGYPSKAFRPWPPARCWQSWWPPMRSNRRPGAHRIRGRVDAARRVQAGEAFDVVILASDAIDKLAASGHVRAGSKVDLVHSGVAVAVREGAPCPTWPRKTPCAAWCWRPAASAIPPAPAVWALARLFERWGIAQEIAPRIVQAPPGVPVGTLVARARWSWAFSS